MTPLDKIRASICSAWRLDPADEKTIFEGGSSPTLRVAVADMVHTTLHRLFVDPEDEARWLRDPIPALDATTPLASMLTGMDGLLRVWDVAERMVGRS